ncbi:MAG: MFS transporter [Armatimonadota bacterium]
MTDTRSEGDTTEHTRWNFPVLVGETAVFVSGLAWVDPATVLPLFITRLGGSPLLVGLVTVLQRLGYMLPQLPMAAILGHRPRRAPFLRWGVLIGRMPMLAFVVYLWTAGTEPHGFVLAFMLFAYFSTSAGNGVVAVPWQDMIAKSIPSAMRGRFFASMQFTTSLATIGVGLAVKWILGSSGPGFPLSYAVLFALLAAFFTVSTILCWMMREPIRPALDEPESMAAIVRSAGPLFRGNRAFRYLVLTGFLGSSLTFTTPFYMVYAKVKLSVPEAMAGVYILAMTISGACFAWLWGRLNDRCGPQSVVKGSCIMLALAPALALVVPAAIPVRGGVLYYAMALVFMAAGAAGSGMFMGLMNYLFELTSHQERHRYIALMSLLTAPGALTPALIGWMLEQLPFATVFGLMGLLGVAASAAALRMPALRPGIGESPEVV